MKKEERQRMKEEGRETTNERRGAGETERQRMKGEGGRDSELKKGGGETTNERRRRKRQ